MLKECVKCNSELIENARFCSFCGEEIIEDRFNYRIEDNNIVLKEGQGNSGFSSVTIYAYADRLELVNKKGIAKVYRYDDLKSVSKSIGTVSMITMNDKQDSFGVKGNADEWVNFIKSKITYISDEKVKKGGIFTGVQKSAAIGVYETTKKFLKARDGNVHVVMVNSFSKFLNQNFGCEDKYTVQIDEIISSMQEDGYEIVDIKFNSIRNQGLLGEMEGYHTLIMYK